MFIMNWTMYQVNSQVPYFLITTRFAVCLQYKRADYREAQVCTGLAKPRPLGQCLVTSPQMLFNVGDGEGIWHS